MAENAWTSRDFRNTLRARMALDFAGWDHPQRELLLGLRRGWISGKVTPAEAMECWIAEKRPPGMRGLPVPCVSSPDRLAFLRLLAERDRIPADGDRQTLHLRNTFWSAMHVVAIQQVDPGWRGTRVLDIELPEQVGPEFVANRTGGDFYAALWCARNNLSYLVVAGHDEIAELLIDSLRREDAVTAQDGNSGTPSPPRP